jgi:uncharacterized protein with FMN-binding domain
MRRAVLAILSTITGLVMLLSFKTHTVSGTTAAGVPPAVISSTPAPTGSSAPMPSNGATGPAATKTVTGNSVDTRWGPVQVQITVGNGRITAAQAVVYPQSNGRDQEINSYAVPKLNAEAVSASSANIDMVSGATYTSQGYLSSLQSALDKAKA